LKSPVKALRTLPYSHRLDQRDLADIDTLVIHCTELPDLEIAREYGERLMHVESQTGNSGHFYIDRDGRTEQWVPLEFAAHHVKDHNFNTIGVELVNLGRYPDWFHSENQQMTESYPDVQIDALIKLVEYLQETLTGLRWVAGHEDIDTAMLPASDKPEILVRRKLDPGIQFPWDAFLADVSLERLPTETESKAK
jgi:N-acetylmuramoyl-L-alanine amidase